MSGILRSFRSYNYRVWTVGTLISNVGTWMQRTAQDWLVLTELTHNNASAVGIVMALQFGPQLLFLPWSGYAADHFDRRKLMMVTQAIMGGIGLLLGILTIMGHIQLWEVYLLSFLFGCTASFDAPARQTFVAELVDKHDLSNAIGLNSTSFNAARMIGPAVAGLVIAGVGSGWAFLLNGLSFFAVLASLACMRLDELHSDARVAKGHGTLTAGFRYVKERRDLLTMLIMTFIVGTFGLNFPIYISAMAVSVFHTQAGGYGFLSSAMAIGTLSGALIAANTEEPRFPTLLVSTALFGVASAVAALAPGYWSFAGLLALIGISSLMFLNTSNSLMQITTDASVRGRVIAIRMAILMGGAPIGAPICGWVADTFGPRASLGIAAISGIISAGIAAIYLINEQKKHESVNL